MLRTATSSNREPSTDTRRRCCSASRSNSGVATVDVTDMFGRKKPPSPPHPDTDLRCSFCHKSQRQVLKLIAGPKVYICDECVDICLNILSEDRRNSASVPAEPIADVWPPASVPVKCGLCGTVT